jgi:hypothetical protein
MPSSLIFTGLVVLWLLILVPAVARRRQEVAHLSGASLGGRVLERPRRGGHPSEEGSSVDDEDARTTGTRSRDVWVPRARAGGSSRGVVPPARRDDDPEPDVDRPADPAADELDDGSSADDRAWERPPPRYRRGRGGFDPEADAEAARRRYAFRQRVVLALLVTAVLTAVVAAVVLPVVWWAHAAVDLVLVAYLVYLRRQVREEAAIRERRAARMAGTRRPSAAEDRELDEWARRGRDLTRPSSSAGPDEADPDEDLVDELGDELDEDGDTTRVRGVGEPVGLLPARRRGSGEDEPESALPRLAPSPPPPLPPGTSIVDVDDDDLDLHDLDTPAGSHRRAVGR